MFQMKFLALKADFYIWKVSLMTICKEIIWMFSMKILQKQPDLL